MKRTALCAVALVFFQAMLCVAARADEHGQGFVSDGALYSSLQSTIPEENSFATEYITGVIDAHNKITLDVPREAKVKQLVDIVHRYLKEHSWEIHSKQHVAYKAVLASLYKKFFFDKNASRQDFSFINGDELYAAMESDTTKKQTYALGYIIGVADSYDEIFFKIPTHMTAKQVLDIVNDYFKIHPGKKQKMAHRLVVWALAEKYPLKKNLSGSPQL